MEISKIQAMTIRGDSVSQTAAQAAENVEELGLSLNQDVEDSSPEVEKENNELTDRQQKTLLDFVKSLVEMVIEFLTGKGAASTDADAVDNTEKVIHPHYNTTAETSDTTETSEKITNPKTYDESITMTDGEKTPYRLEVGGKVYYYSSAMELASARTAKDPSQNATGTGDVQKDWGVVTQYSIEARDGSTYYFSFEDYPKAKMMTEDAMKEIACGRNSSFVGRPF